MTSGNTAPNNSDLEERARRARLKAIMARRAERGDEIPHLIVPEAAEEQSKTVRIALAGVVAVLALAGPFLFGPLIGAVALPWLMGAVFLAGVFVVRQCAHRKKVRESLEKAALSRVD